MLIQGASLEQIRKIGSEENHLKMALEQDGEILDAIGFHIGHLYEEITPVSQISVVGKLSINEWNGHCKPQLMIEDIGVEEWQLFDWRNMKRMEERLRSLPEDKRIYIAFRQETLQLLPEQERMEVFLVNYERGDLPSLEGKYAVLLDLPNSPKGIEQLFFNQPYPERVYTVFFQEETHFFSTMPTREYFKWFYGFLLKRKEFDLNKFGHQLATHKGWSKDTIEFMAQVFLELGFVTIDNGLMKLKQDAQKKDLQASSTYLRKMNQTKLENDFLYSSYYDLKQWFDQLFFEERKVKETAN